MQMIFYYIHGDFALGVAVNTEKLVKIQIF